MTGIANHSQADRNFIVFSVNDATKHQFINVANHRYVKEALKADNVPFKELVGSYKGERELSFIVPLNGSNLALVKHLMREHKQDCFLQLENHKHGMYKAYFVYTQGDGVKRFQGYLRSMDKATIDKLKLDYSVTRGEKPDYFTIWPTDTCTLDAFEAEKANYNKA